MLKIDEILIVAIHDDLKISVNSFIGLLYALKYRVSDKKFSGSMLSSVDQDNGAIWTAIGVGIIAPPSKSHSYSANICSAKNLCHLVVI